jgi:hypothetical protein
MLWTKPRKRAKRKAEIMQGLHNHGSLYLLMPPTLSPVAVRDLMQDQLTATAQPTKHSEQKILLV